MAQTIKRTPNTNYILRLEKLVATLAIERQTTIQQQSDHIRPSTQNKCMHETPPNPRR